MSFELCLQSNYPCLCICFSFQLWLVFSTTNRMKNRPLTIIEPQAHKKLNPALDCECSESTRTYFLYISSYSILDRPNDSIQVNTHRHRHSREKEATQCQTLNDTEDKAKLVSYICRFATPIINTIPSRSVISFSR